jgi:hypothetical protein
VSVFCHIPAPSLLKARPRHDFFVGRMLHAVSLFPAPGEYLTLLGRSRFNNKMSDDAGFLAVMHYSSLERHALSERSDVFTS